MAEQFRQLLQNTSAADLIEKDRALYSVTSTTTVEETLQVLAEHKVLSVPVNNTKGECTNFVDVLDILSFLGSLCKDINTLTHLKVETFAGKPVGEIVNMSNKDPFVTVNETDGADSILDLFARGVHRVAVKDSDGKVTTVLSQFDFVKFVASHIDTFPELAKKTIKEIGLVQSWVLHVRKTERAIACFKKMVENGMNAVSIVDVEGKLDAHLSSDSLRGLTAESIKTLRLPVEEFLSARHVPSGKAFVCVGVQSFEEIIKQLVEQSTHRLWVEDAAGFPVGVVSLTDVCSILKNQ